MSSEGQLAQARGELAELQERHTRALELVGQREDELTDVQADFLDAKALYRTQITQLLDQIEQLKTNKP